MRTTVTLDESDIGEAIREWCERRQMRVVGSVTLTFERPDRLNDSGTFSAIVGVEQPGPLPKA